MTPPRVLWLHSDRTGCGSYRAYIPALTLEEEGSFVNRMVLHAEMGAHFRALDDVALVVFQRAVSPLFKRWVEECQRRGIATVFELDDHLFRIPKHNPAAAYWAQKSQQRLLQWTLESCDHVICSTAPLREALLAHTHLPDTKVTVAMNHLHPAIWGTGVIRTALPHDNQGRLVIGYQGSATHNVDFATAVPALARVIAEHPHVVLRFFGYVPPAIKGVIPTNRFQYAQGVPFEHYPQKLAYLNFDIGLAPLTDSRFNQSKSNLKFLEYSALGIPAVCGRVYPYATTVRHGETGYLATTEDEWYTALTALVTDEALRARVGAAAHAALWREWGPDARVGGWRDVFQRLVSKREVSCATS